VSYVGCVCCWFSSLLRGFFSGYSGFPPSIKTNISKFLFDLDVKWLHMSPWLGRLGDYSPHYDVKFDFYYYYFLTITEAHDGQVLPLRQGDKPRVRSQSYKTSFIWKGYLRNLSEIKIGKVGEGALQKGRNGAHEIWPLTFLFSRRSDPTMGSLFTIDYWQHCLRQTQ